MKRSRPQSWLLFLGALLIAASFSVGSAAAAASLNGRILLQVQDKGQAWYVDPQSAKRFYLGRPDDAWRVMRAFGLGVSNKDLTYFWNNKAPVRLSGRILLQVEDKGQAYYVNPLTLKLSYLGRPTDAFAVIRSFGLGISNSDLARIPLGILGASPSTTTAVPAPSITKNVNRTFNFKYKNAEQSLVLALSDDLYKTYSASPKVYSYPANNPPADLQGAFYGMFLKMKSGDTSISDIAYQLKALALKNNWSSDELLESALALIQYIPYDQVKADSGVNNPLYPYEILYLNKGVCSDKTFLAVALIKNLGYGTAIMDFPDINHSTVGIACPVAYSVSGSGYCYAETTNYFPIGVIPNSISGQARSGDYGFDTLFDEQKLGTIQIILKSQGNLYQGVAATRQKVADLSSLYNDIVSSRSAAENDYNSIIIYNEKVNTFNRLLTEFYQQ
ncbi:MAG: hypothetical protein HY931_01615 [Candidatus Falkowbacteria bacterium]|nr:MAG: hypothetical protein HY931_01615 [Candidatus Falkowbacteria bacterium]